MKIPLRVPNPPTKPLIIWDGECHFCRRWIERWREITRDAVDYATSQESAERFPEIPREQFERSVIYIETDGRVFLGAEAVFRSLRCRSSKKWLAWSYDHVPGFAAVSESFYRIIAFNRRFASAITRLLCGGGVVLSLLLIFGIAPALSLVGLVVFYLSLTIAGQTFLSFQWDILLLETGFLSIFLAPWRLWPKRGLDPPVSRAALFLLKLLLFKLMVMSGVVKLTSGDDSWWDLTALDYHYWSQPLPTVIGWWADQSPEWFKKFSVAFCLVVEIIVPFFIWAPRRLRLLACGLLVFLQITIAATGNYCFFNLLAIALCLLLIDDAVVETPRGNVSPDRTVRGQRSAVSLPDRFSIYAAEIVIVLTLPLNARLIYGAFKPEAEWSPMLGRIYARVEAFRIVNGYGLFRVMTKDRREIVIEGSSDGIDWKPYEFKWKPGDVMRAPGWCAPHQPRLDWQMWFAALGSYQQNPWFVRTAICLLEGKSD